MRYLMLLSMLMGTACAAQETPPPTPFQQTGVIEGFYGPPWSHQDRLDMIRFMGQVGLTHYYYAPKDDPYHRARWREAYPSDRMAELRALVTACREGGIRFVYAISPGGSMVYSDSVEYATLHGKIQAMATLGIRDFALFFDDVPPTLQHDEDRRAFGSLAEAHASVITRLQRDLTAAGATLVVTPTTYTNAWGDRASLRLLGQLVSPDVPFFWTGVDVASPEITAQQAREWGDLLGRPPLVWDNYPVNDYARWRPFLGPLRGRAIDLSARVSGIIANPMNEAHLSMIPLATLAAYVHQPRSYDPLAAIEQALVMLYGADVAQVLEPFVRIYGDYGWDQNLFEPLYVPGEPIDVERIRDGLRQLTASIDRLDTIATQHTSLVPLATELRPFVTQTASRLTALERDPRYERRGRELVFRNAVDRLTIRTDTATVIPDGALSEWTQAEWTELRGRGSGPWPEAAFRVSTAFLHIALRIPLPPRNTFSGMRIGEGDHTALILQHDADASRRHLTPDDLVILIQPPSTSSAGAVAVRSLDFRGFMAKWLADNHDLNFAEFHLSTFGQEPTNPVLVEAAGTLTGDGYALEISLPRSGRDTLRFSLTVTGDVGGRRETFALAHRNYPANPATYSEIVVVPEDR